ncbi:hypothetical protein KY290_033370 [Solanum tuberosum]|uniref:Uncharacterized protein n=1 Tax=Solanum tuberosum TaxID=4113 RepID=A0ABQ7U203_SOLTU|nr:hypothetical protein KY289_032737 [Solanum tuberosum]KAH0647375.1 hypothetical protein KY285_032623 [Solanum tuberosum]KAH0740327.1 hypothetical protein KY290_033370 [Solanum tuberosum]
MLTEIHPSSRLLPLSNRSGNGDWSSQGHKECESSFSGMKVQQFHTYQELPQQAKAIIQLEKSHTPNIRVQKIQNKDYKGHNNRE